MFWLWVPNHFFIVTISHLYLGEDYPFWLFLPLVGSTTNLAVEWFVMCQNPWRLCVRSPSESYCRWTDCWYRKDPLNSVVVLITPGKINMEPQNVGLEDDYPFSIGWFLCSMLIFRGVIIPFDAPLFYYMSINHTFSDITPEIMPEKLIMFNIKYL